MSDVLYHYCSTEAFHSIISSRTIRLSALKLSNDSREGKLVEATLERLYEQDELPQEKREQLRIWFSNLDEMCEGLGFCLSSADDLLGQWRGYANDLKGVAIGFSKAYLVELQDAQKKTGKPAIGLREVLYTHEQHDALIRSVYNKIRDSLESPSKSQQLAAALRGYSQSAQTRERVKGISPQSDTVMSGLMRLVGLLFDLKDGAFSEEREWRLISYNVLPRVIQAQGYRTTPDCIIPYFPVELPELSHPAITHVRLGPRHQTPPLGIKSFLYGYGFEDVKVERSTVPYR